MKSKFIPAVCCAAVLLSGTMLATPKFASGENLIRASADAIDEPSTCLLTTLNLALSKSESGGVAATLTNNFTLFPSIVEVYLALYSSLTKTTDLSKMTLEASAYSADLNMGECLLAESSTHGEDRYWIGYAIYYKNSGNSIYQTDPTFFYADGTYNPAL